jgi:hypothetical protein
VRSRVSVVVVALVVSLLVYAVIAITRRWWPSTVTAPVVAALLWRRHRRARFTAYVFFSVLAARGVLTGVWALPAYAVTAIALLQTPAAQAAWPRLTPGRRPTESTARPERPAPDDRMRRS